MGVENPEVLGSILNASGLKMDDSDDDDVKGLAKRPVPGFDCTVLNAGLSTSAVFAGCGVLNALNKPGFDAPGPWEESEGVLESPDEPSFFCAAPKPPNPEKVGAGAAVGVLAGFVSDAKGFAFGVSEDASLFCFDGVRPLNRLFDVEVAFS